MGKGIILRVREGEVLSSELLKTLDKRLPSYKLEYFKDKPNYQQSIKRRMNSLYGAFLFVLDAYPPNPKHTHLSIDVLKNHVATCKIACNNSLTNKVKLDELHLELEKFTAKLVESLSLCHDWPKEKAIKEATATLNEAEQYMLMNQGRYDLATLLPIHIGNKKAYVLQLDESLPSYDDQLVRDIQEIKLQQYPKTKALFLTLNQYQDYQKTYFYNLDSTITKFQDISDELLLLIKGWNNIKPDTDDLVRINQNTLPLPAWFNKLSEPLQFMLRFLSKESVSSVLDKLKQFEQKINDDMKKTQGTIGLSNVAKIPEWYWVLSDREQFFLAHVLKNTPTIEGALSFISSRLRTIPLPANFAKHSLYLITDDCNVQLQGKPRYRSSHIASRDILDCSAAVQLRHSSSNFAKVMQHAEPGQPALLQTLISPVSGTQYLGLPDLALYNQGRRTVAQSGRVKETIYTNHPYNIAKYAIYTAANNEDCLRLITMAKTHNTNCPELKQLLTDYANVLNSCLGSATFWDYEGRELFLSSLEQLIILNISGLSYGSCVSGKDRKAIELIHTDAMLLYKKLHGFWPLFGDPKDKKERVGFVKIVVNLYTSRHQHEHAGQNAPGSEGIKTPSKYFPNDISEAINIRMGTENALKYDDRLATDNEVKHISSKLKSFLSTKNGLLCQLMAEQLGEINCRKLYDALVPLINEKQLFKNADGVFSSFFGPKNKTSAGIESIFKLMVDGNADDAIAVAAQIFSIVLERPGPELDEYSGRSDATKSVYNRTRDLLNPQKSGASLQVALDFMIKEWESLFNTSKDLKEPIESKKLTSSYIL